MTGDGKGGSTKSRSRSCSVASSSSCGEPANQRRGDRGRGRGQRGGYRGQRGAYRGQRGAYRGRNPDKRDNGQYGRSVSDFSDDRSRDFYYRSPSDAQARAVVSESAIRSRRDSPRGNRQSFEGAANLPEAERKSVDRLTNDAGESDSVAPCKESASDTSGEWNVVTNRKKEPARTERTDSIPADRRYGDGGTRGERGGRGGQVYTSDRGHRGRGRGRNPRGSSRGGFRSDSGRRGRGK